MKKLLFAALTIMIIGSCSKKDTTPATPAPTVSFSWQTASTTAPTTVIFTNTSTNATSYLWEFGDGSSSNASTLQNPQHTYTTGGTFTVTLTATGSGGSASNSASITILNSTKLQIKVLDINANVVSGAAVKLYGTFADWQNNTNQIGTTLSSNSNGIVTFSGLQSKIYYWDASNGCMNNYNNSYYNINNLTPNAINTFSTIVTETGTLKFISNSTNPYKVEVNGIVAFNSMAGGTTQYLYYKPATNYTVKVTQLSGYVFSPTIKSYTGNLTCGNTLTITYPN